MDFAPIADVLEDLRQGKMIILVDDEDRENEGDLVMAAEKVTAGAVNFMATHARGLICLTLTEDDADQIGVPLMTGQNTSNFGTAFTISIDSAYGVTTGISAQDRAKTIYDAVKDGAKESDFTRPGHIFPLRARQGGVLVRAGQTEGSVDLARLAGLKPAGVICEIMNEDGTMSRLPELQKYAKQHDLKICSVANIIDYRRHHERLVEKVVSVKMPTPYGDFNLHLYKSLVDEYLHIAMCAGDVGLETKGNVLVQDEPVLVRVHSECLTGDIFSSLRCDCGEQLDRSLHMIAKSGKGVLLYIRQEGRGIGLEQKLKSYQLQEQGMDTVDANIKLGFPPDLREYGTGAQILVDLGIRKMKLITNNPKKLISVHGHGLEVVERVPIEVEPNDENRAYLKTKQSRLGHMFDFAHMDTDA